MRNVLLATLVFSVVAIADASAQNAMSNAPGKSAPSTSAPKAGTGSAPVGHRQPTQAEVGKADADPSAVSAEDKELDRKIKNICRGC